VEETSKPSAGAQFAQGTAKVMSWLWRLGRGEVVKRVGGTARARVIVLFGLVLALNGADLATVGAVAPQLESSLHISNTQIGLLSAVTLLIGAIATIPVGLLVDRVTRIPLLSLSIVLWSIASLLSAFAGSYSSLLLTRLILGVVVATAGPAIASLTGDYFPASERGRVYAYILGGEIAGAAVGFIVCGSVAVITWRAAFVLLAIPGFFLARELFRTVPEPLRGGQSFLAPGVEDLDEVARAAREARRRDPSEATTQASVPNEPLPEHDDLARIAVEEMGIEPNPELVLEADPQSLNLVDSIRYILRIPTNVLMIVSSSLGYFFFSGLQVFALLFIKGHYHVGQATAELVLGVLVAGAMVGTLVSGKVTDELVRHGSLNSRVWIPAFCYVGASLLLIPAFVANSLFPSLWLAAIGAALLMAANPPLDAARLDIMPAGLWGRAESVRTSLRSLAQALAPLVFGGLADLIAGFYPAQAPIGTHTGPVDHNTAHGLEITFLLLLLTLAASGFSLLRARHTYLTDVATAAASNQGRDEQAPAPRTDISPTVHSSLQSG